MSEINPLLALRAIRDSGHKANEKLVLVALVLRVENATGRCSISIGKLASDTSLSRRTVQRVLAEIQRKCTVLDVRGQVVGGTTIRSNYELHIPRGLLPKTTSKPKASKSPGKP